MLKIIGIALLVLLVVLGVAGYIRRSIRDYKEGMKGVDRSKLRDLDQDDWDDDQR